MDCHKCGCNRLNLMEAGQYFGRPWVIFECDFCHTQIRIGNSRNGKASTEYTKTVCPQCGGRAPVSGHPPGGAKRTGVRYHKCAECGWRFKSVEKK